MASRSRRASLFLLLLDLELKKFQEYRDSVSGSFASELERIGSEADALSEEEQEPYIDWMYDEIALVRDDFPPLLRSTTFIALYSVLEHRLRSVCDLLRQGDVRELKRKPSESFLGKARRFIVAKCNNEFPDQSPEWCMLNGHFRLIRNCLVHDAGEVGGDTKLLQAVRALKGILLNDKKEIVLEDEFLDVFAGSIRAFFGDLAPRVL